jgi:hypothetical protein
MRCFPVSSWPSSSQNFTRINDLRDTKNRGNECKGTSQSRKNEIHMRLEQILCVLCNAAEKEARCFHVTGSVRLCLCSGRREEEQKRVTDPPRRHREGEWLCHTFSRSESRAGCSIMDLKDVKSPPAFLPRFESTCVWRPAPQCTFATLKLFYATLHKRLSPWLNFFWKQLSKNESDQSGIMELRSVCIYAVKYSVCIFTAQKSG